MTLIVFCTAAFTSLSRSISYITFFFLEWSVDNKKYVETYRLMAFERVLHLKLFKKVLMQ